MTESVQANVSFANVLVTILAASQTKLGVVQVHGPEPRQVDVALELGQCLFKSCGRVEGVAGGDGCSLREAKLGSDFINLATWVGFATILYMLRVWQDTPDGPLRYMLKAADDDHRHVFADAQSLAEFLAQIMPDIRDKGR